MQNKSIESGSFFSKDVLIKGKKKYKNGGVRKLAKDPFHNPLSTKKEMLLRLKAKIYLLPHSRWLRRPT